MNKILSVIVAVSLLLAQVSPPDAQGKHRDVQLVAVLVREEDEEPP